MKLVNNIFTYLKKSLNTDTKHRKSISIPKHLFHIDYRTHTHTNSITHNNKSLRMFYPLYKYIHAYMWLLPHTRWPMPIMRRNRFNYLMRTCVRVPRLRTLSSGKYRFVVPSQNRNWKKHRIASARNFRDSPILKSVGKIRTCLKSQISLSLNNQQSTRMLPWQHFQCFVNYVFDL